MRDGAGTIEAAASGEDKMTNRILSPFFNWSVAIGALLASVLVISRLLEMPELSAPARLTLAAVPVIAFVFVIIGHVRMVRMLDELQQRIYLEALAIAFPSVAVVTIACEYLRKAGFITHLKPDHVLMILIACWLVGFFIAKRHYR